MPQVQRPWMTCYSMNQLHCCVSLRGQHCLDRLQDQSRHNGQSSSSCRAACWNQIDAAVAS